MVSSRRLHLGISAVTVSEGIGEIALGSSLGVLEDSLITFFTVFLVSKGLKLGSSKLSRKSRLYPFPCTGGNSASSTASFVSTIRLSLIVFSDEDSFLDTFFNQGFFGRGFFTFSSTILSPSTISSETTASKGTSEIATSFP